VLRSDGRIAFPEGSQGFREQARRLRDEGVAVANGRVRIARAVPDLDAEVWGMR
jgi:methylated-DNA-protein-cysteine methyltransferase-like protein